MIKFLAFCGYFFAHAIWCVSEGDILIAFAGMQNYNIICFFMNLGVRALCTIARFKGKYDA